jgi:hypothetical protein
MKRKNWKAFKGGYLPQAALDLVNSVDTCDWGWQYYSAWYKNDGSKPEDWIVSTDNGSYYKVGAISMTWWIDGVYEMNEEDVKIHDFSNPELAKRVRAKANWTISSMKKTIAAIKRGENPPFDPKYTT